MKDKSVFQCLGPHIAQLGMAFAAADDGVLDIALGFGTHGVDRDALAQAKKRRFDRAFEHQMGATILQQDIGHRTGVAMAGLPFASFRVAVDQAAFLAIGATMKIGVVKLTLFASGCFHVGAIVSV